MVYENRNKKPTGKIYTIDMFTSCLYLAVSYDIYMIHVCYSVEYIPRFIPVPSKLIICAPPCIQGMNNEQQKFKSMSFYFNAWTPGVNRLWSSLL